MTKSISRFPFASEGLLILGAILLTALPAHAAAIPSAGVYLSTPGPILDQNSGGGLAAAHVFYGRGASPPEVIYIQSDASASANGAFGRVRSSSFLETI